MLQGNIARGLALLLASSCLTFGGEQPISGSGSEWIDGVECVWVVPSLPPHPPGLPPPPPLAPILVRKNPTRVMIDAQTTEARRQAAVLQRMEAIAPNLTDADLMDLARAREFSKVESVRPLKLVPAFPTENAPSSDSLSWNELPSISLQDDQSPVQPLNGEEDGGQITLRLVEKQYDPGLDLTMCQLWLIGVDPGMPWDIMFNNALDDSPWSWGFSGVADFHFDNVDVFFVYLAGDPQMAFFQVFPVQDSDGDGLLDSLEAAMFRSSSTSPDSAFSVDLDGDGLPDFPQREANYIADGDEDLDGDGRSNLKELQLGLDPFVAESNAQDSDGDGLPDWSEYLIFLYWGQPNPAPRDDSDGDGVDNYTEVAVGTDPSFPDYVYQYYDTLPDPQRAFDLPPITVQRTGGGGAPVDLVFDTVGTLGTYVHVSVERDRDQNGNPLPGFDTINFGGAYLSPGPIGLELLEDGDNPGDGLIDLGSLLIGATGLLASIWEEAQISDLLDQLSRQQLVVIQQRSMLRAIVRVREIQVALDLQDMSGVTQMRIRKAISEVHTEVTLFHETSVRIHAVDGEQWGTRAGKYISGAGRVATVFSFAGAAVGAYSAAKPYIWDVRRRCDNNGETASDLALALSNLAGVVANGFELFNLWLIYWDQLSEFDGYSTQC